jgi:hypothetical protein
MPSLLTAFLLLLLRSVDTFPYDIVRPLTTDFGDEHHT